MSYIVFYGLQGSGKSTFINALLGKDILPANELRPTAWPCRIRHSPTQTEPKLELHNIKAFQKAVNKLKSRKPKLSTLVKDSDDTNYDPYRGASGGSGSASDSTQHINERSYRKWNDLVAKPQDTLEKFEEVGFKLNGTAVGVRAIGKLLGQLHDLVRLCDIFDVPIPETVRKSYKRWPLISLRIEAFGEVETQFELVDLPGLHPNVSFRSDWVDIVSKDALAIIPVISFESRDRWDPLVRHFKELPPPLIVCTHCNKLTVTKEMVAQHLNKISREFRAGNSREIVQFTDARLALGLQMLKGGSKGSADLSKYVPVGYSIEKIAGTAGRDAFLENRSALEKSLNANIGNAQKALMQALARSPPSHLSPTSPLAQFYGWLSKFFSH